MNNQSPNLHSLEWLYNTIQSFGRSGRPRFEKLIEGTRFNRKLTSTYSLVIYGCILVLSIIHWSEKAIRWRERKLRRERARSSDTDSLDEGISRVKSIQDDATCHRDTGSSESSIFGTEIHSRENNNGDEIAPLLHHRHNSTPLLGRATTISRLKELLIYQPRPIPYFNKVLPSNRSSLFIISFLALNLFYTVYHITWSAFEGSVFGDRAGLVFGINLSFLYVLGAKNQPLKFMTGVSYESLNIIHRRLGELLLLEAIIHAIGMFLLWSAVLQPTGQWPLSRFLFDWTICVGLGTLLTYEILFATSLASFRQRWYEMFLGIHVVLQAGALVLLYLHHRGARPFVLKAVVIFIIDRLVYRIGVKRINVTAVASVYEDNETILLSFEIKHKPGNDLSRAFGHSIEEGWMATDHVFITIPSLGRSHALQAHPFTIASAPPVPGNTKTKLDLLIRARDGFSADLLRAAQLEKSLTCRLDGPYGSSHARELLEHAGLAILVAGGSGIAVTWPIIHHLLRISRSDAENAMPVCRQRIVLIWVIHKPSHISWLNHSDLEEVKSHGVEVVIPRATTEAGRPDLEGMMEGIVENWGYGKHRNIGVVVSGPDGMNRTVNNTCAKFVRDGRNLEVTIEKFGW